MAKTIAKTDEQFFAKGADIGWLQQMEATGYVFYDESGKNRDCLEILQEHGINSVRLRVWVNPSENPHSGHNSIEDVAIMAKRAADMGFKIMIDFHYSDSWADPGKQNKPAAWKDHSIGHLARDVYDHTFNSLSLLKQKMIPVTWVQVGNEISNGMLWPEGHTDNFSNLALFINQGYAAVKEVFPATQVIVHLDEGNNGSKFKDFFDQLAANGGKYDLVGMSYYPYWLNTHYSENIEDLKKNINAVIGRFGKDVIITEIGGIDEEADITHEMLSQVIKILREVPNNSGRGIFYWEPQGARSWSRYKLSAWGADGKPTKALKAFLE